MNIILYGNKSLHKLKLPSTVEGSFFLHDPITKNILLNFEAFDDSWVLKTNDEVKVYDCNNNQINHTVIKNNEFYLIVYKERKSIIHCTTNYDNTPMIFKVNNGANIRFGKTNENDVIYNNQYIQNNHMILSCDNDFWKIQIKPNSFVYINDNLVQQENKILNNGDYVNAFGLNIFVMKNLIILNNPENSVTIQNNVLNPFQLSLVDTVNINDATINDEVSEEDLYTDNDYFFKTPRLRRFVETYDLTVSNPPAKQQQEEMPLLLTVGPMFTMALMSVIMASNVIMKIVNGEATLEQSWMSLISPAIMLTSSLLWPSLTKRWQKKNRKKKEKNRVEKYRAYLEEKKKLILGEAVNQTAILKENLLDLQSCYNVILNKDRILWERKISQKDFLTVRVGIGDKPLDMDVKFNEDDFTIEKDELKDEASKMIEEAKMLRNVPISYSFLGKVVTGILGKPHQTKHFLDNLLLQLITFHSYDELKIVIFTDEEHESNWEDYRELPHLFSNNKQVRFFATNDEERKNISSYLMQELTKRALDSKSSDAVENESENKTFSPYYLILTDDYIKIRKLDICEQVFSINVDMGFGFVVLDEKLSRLPSRCIDFITVDNSVCGILKNDVDNYEQISFKNEINPGINMSKCVEVLSNIPIEFDESSTYLPTSLTFLEMYGVGKVEQLNIMNRWKLNDPTTSLKAPIGVNDQNNLIILDLHEKFHGPHGLIAGTTGSGKSEFIITYILSMAINYSPNEVSFILIDYKGGGLAGAFENKKNNIRLPHLAGTITNLDKNEMNRTLVSIQSELKRRQTVFNRERDNLGESTIDIYKYQKFFRAGKIQEPMPHLFIICDEFAELKQQQPEFMDNLISAARIGRSLGVHLILATQKPSGVVNDQIWSNTKFRVCLKVAEKGDSNEVIKRPDAAEIKNAGRFYLQVGYNEIFVLGQSGWCGAPYSPSDIVKKEYDRSISVIDNVGNVIKNFSSDVTKKKIVADGDELSNILQYITLLAKRDNLRSPSLWLDSMSPEITLDQIINKYNYSSDEVFAVLGEYDDPANQYQNILTLTLNEEGNTMIYGLSSGNREMFLRTYIYSLCSRYSSNDVNFYIFDFGSESFGIFSKIPHVGDVVLSTEAEKIDKLLKMIEKEIFDRKKLFADYNGEYVNYCKNSGSKLPIINVIINNLESFKELYQVYDELLLKLVREGKRCGILFTISTSTQSGLYSRFLKNFNNEFVLDMNSKEGYMDILGKIGNIYPADVPGRGLFRGESVYEFQTASIGETDNMIEFIKSKAEELSKTNPKAKSVPVLPDYITLDMLENYLTSLKSVPIGIIKETLKPYLYNFKGDKATLISSNDLENCKEIVSNLLKQFKKLENTLSILIDSEEVFSEFKPLADSYCFEKFDEFIKQIVDFIDQKIVNSQYNLVVVITGVEKLKNSAETANIDSLMKKIKTVDNCNALIVESGYKLKKMAFETWYNDLVVNSNGIWVGSGVSEQTSIKASEYNKKYTVQIKNDFAWVFKNGAGQLTKLIGGENSNEE